MRGAALASLNEQFPFDQIEQVSVLISRENRPPHSKREPGDLRVHGTPHPELKSMLAPLPRSSLTENE